MTTSRLGGDMSEKGVGIKGIKKTCWLFPFLVGIKGMIFSIEKKIREKGLKTDLVEHFFSLQSPYCWFKERRLVG